jgi:hypothetical protein
MTISITLNGGKHNEISADWPAVSLDPVEHGERAVADGAVAVKWPSGSHIF